MEDYSQLPEELIHLVLKRRLYIEDFVRFGAACKSWQSVFAATREKENPCFTPWLMLTNDDADAQNLRTFSCLSNRRDVTIELPGIHGRLCWGSPYGWLVTFGVDLSIHLLNPFSGVRLSLPHQFTFPNQYPRQLEPEFMRRCCPRRFILSSNPSLTLTPNSGQSCIVIAICNPEGKLSFARPGDEAWTAVETSLLWFSDAIYFKGQIYAITTGKCLMVCDINMPHPQGKQIESPLPYDHVCSDELYLVEMNGELHLVVRYLKSVMDESTEISEHHVTDKFGVYKFNFQKKSWIELPDLGDYALFVGSNTSFAISTSHYPSFKSNAIYYGDDNYLCYDLNFCDMGVFDFEKKTSEPFYLGANVLSSYSRPLFIIPSL